MFIEDAPPSYEILRAVNIDITRVEAVQVSVDLEEGSPTYGLETETVVPLTLERSEVDLLPLRGGRREKIASGEAPRGEYYVRLYLSGGDVVTTTQTYSTDNGLMTLGGGTDAGEGVRQYDVTRQYEQRVSVLEDQTTGVLVDVDLEESLVAEGDPAQPTRIDLIPVIRLREQFEGGIRGVVRSDSGTPDDPSDDVPVENARVFLMQEGPLNEGPEITGQTRTDAQGVYVLQGVRGGTAVFFFVVSAPGHDDHLPGGTLEEPQGTWVTHDVLLRKQTN